MHKKSSSCKIKLYQWLFRSALGGSVSRSRYSSGRLSEFGSNLRSYHKSMDAQSCSGQSVLKSSIEMARIGMQMVRWLLLHIIQRNQIVEGNLCCNSLVGINIIK